MSRPTFGGMWLFVVRGSGIERWSAIEDTTDLRAGVYWFWFVPPNDQGKQDRQTAERLSMSTKKAKQPKTAVSASPTCSAADCRECRNYLKDLIRVTEAFITWIDSEMKKPSTVERGKRIASACNALKMQKDLAKLFGLPRKR